MIHISKSLVSKTVYPLSLAGAVLIHFSLINNGWSLAVATYLPIIFASVLIITLEWMVPERKEWRPSISEFRLDSMYMGFVQMLVPMMLTIFTAQVLMRFLQPTPTNIWPHHLHPLIQIAIILVTAEFFHYWLHRAGHEWPLLWRLHAIHHSPKLLYWLNVGRFHPLEKFLQFFADILPFMLLGVSEEVMALYFVFYAVNGFFQHCNIRLRFGWLNFLFSTAELHRWHHSIDIGESNKNYGNNLIIWDLIFGTWFLPRDHEVVQLGVKGANYHSGFVSHCLAPFKPIVSDETK